MFTSSLRKSVQQKIIGRYLSSTAEELEASFLVKIVGCSYLTFLTGVYFGETYQKNKDQKIFRQLHHRVHELEQENSSLKNDKND